jgi:KaiC/GvpD/RAD55 family RecA-like ATPase
MKLKDKFEFGEDFQENILQYAVTDNNGYRILSLIKDYYFTLVETQIVAAAIKDFFRKKKKVPKSKAILREFIRKYIATPSIAQLLATEDKPRIDALVIRLYRGPVKDGEEVLETALKFARYVELKHALENADLKNFDQYENFSTSIQKAIRLGTEFKENKGTLLIENLRDRQYRRRMQEEAIPTPFRQMNHYTNAGGFPRGSVVVIMGPEKEFKTGALINIGRHNLRSRKKTLYVDLENGQDNLSTRLEQSIMRKSKIEILRGEFDERVQKEFRKYRRLGSEIDIKRFPALTTTAAHIQAYVDDQYSQLGIRYHQVIIDAPHLMGSLDNIKEEEQRIAHVFIEIKNFAERNGFEIVWTAAHTKRDAEKRFATKFVSSDIAKCMDITRTVDAIFGYNRSSVDVELGTARLEIVDQRDGVAHGACLFKVDYKIQRMDELSKAEIDAYYQGLGEESRTNKTNKGSGDDV